MSLTQDSKSWQLTKSTQDIKLALQKCLSHYVRQIKMDGRTPLLLMQECGESIGIWSKDTNLKKRQESYKRAKIFLSDLAQQAKVDLIDPYERILTEQTIPTHWESLSEWNYTGNRIVAETLVAYFFEKLNHRLEYQIRDEKS
jgi:hypothetical protein